MNESDQTIYIGDALQKSVEKEIKGEYVTLLGDRFYKIQNFDAMEPFFMSLVSSSDHWFFISSTGGLSAGRVNSEQSLFPYYTVDKITENSENTGAKVVLFVTQQGKRYLWEPFSERGRGQYHLQRNLYKNFSNTTVIFEETNRDLHLIYRYSWRLSDRYGFVKTTWLINNDSLPCDVEILDGLQNLLPANVSSVSQNTFSVLLDAYKRSELDPDTGLGIFALSSNLTDLPEPSEALLATTVMQVGLTQAEYLLSSQQIDPFRRGEGITPELEVRGQRAAYLVHANVHLAAGAQQSWHLAADVNQDQSAVIRLIKTLKTNEINLYQEIDADITVNKAKLLQIVAHADGLQKTQSEVTTSHHFANVLFNVMRGGIFFDQYWINKIDLQDFIFHQNPMVAAQQAAFLANIPERIQVTELLSRVEMCGCVDLHRLCATYLPLTFSRRHGDPSRPWNRFTINIKKPDGSQNLDYEGNWRDIFQNWEALAWSYPEFIENMVFTFLNATTVDGYNPYRIRRSGADWEQPEPHNPWANIGYWGDHQIIYLLKLMEISTSVHPAKLQMYLAQSIFSYDNIPYRIKPYKTLLKNPFNTIDFDWEVQRVIDERIHNDGNDARLVSGPDGHVYHACLAEKLLSLLLAKLANFVPEGGIWMNTQRPEWNDANNALVGKGLSVVTLCYLRSYLVFCQDLFMSSGTQTVPVSHELADLYMQMDEIFQRFQSVLSDHFSNEQRREMMDALGQAGSDYRWNFYQKGVSGNMLALSPTGISRFCKLVQEFVDHSLRANRRPDNLYHSYNILHLSEDRASISRMVEMLEGQVAILSSGFLSAKEAIILLESLRASSMYHPDQHTYFLYPDRDLPGFLQKNCITPERVQDMKLVQALMAAQDKRLFNQDVDGIFHFNGHIRNIKDVNQVLVELQEIPAYSEFVAVEAGKIRELFEEVFNHSQFTGRSGSFFAYEGLGSIYWHMVSKLLLAVQDNVKKVWRSGARNELPGDQVTFALAKRYADIRQGLGFCKSPKKFGAFPTDAYSHTPKGQGAKQPGMTGQVKEEVLTRISELGLYVQNGQLCFNILLVDPDELLTESAIFTWLDVTDQFQSHELTTGSLAYTFCQVPIILQSSQQEGIEVFYSDGKIETIVGLELDEANSRHIFMRDGFVHHLCVNFLPKNKHENQHSYFGQVFFNDGPEFLNLSA
jgi:hypothetical protein